jgi:hypothetical protein
VRRPISTSPNDQDDESETEQSDPAERRTENEEQRGADGHATFRLELVEVRPPLAFAIGKDQ